MLAVLAAQQLRDDVAPDGIGQCGEHRVQRK